MLEAWIVEELSGKPGASVFYSDLAITTMATFKAVYRLAGRQCQGFVESIFELMTIDSTRARPQHPLALTRSTVYPASSCAKGVRRVVVDSTGVKVYGEGEWKTRQHGISKQRTWRKLHLGVDEERANPGGGGHNQRLP